MLALANPALGSQPTISGWDCSNPTNLKVYDSSDRCTPEAVAPVPKVKAWVVQHTPITEISGYRCTITRKETAFICGLWSYEKALRSSGGQEPFTLTGPQCEVLVRTKNWRADTNGKTTLFPVVVPGYTSVNVAELGWSGLVGGDTACQGRSTVINGVPVDRVVEYAVYGITITEEALKVEQNSMLAMTSRETLRCPSTRGQCGGALHSYTWPTGTAHRCPYSLVKSINGVLQDSVFYSESSALVLQVLPQLPPDGQCPGLQLHPTQLERIFISDAQPQLPTVTAEDVSISIMLESIAAFIKDAVQVSHQEVQLALQRTSCLNLRDIPMDLGTARIRDRPGLNLFGLGRADSYYEFECRPVMLKLREAPNCYLGAIPVVHDTLPFVHDRTRILQATGTVTPCLEYFPVRVRGTQGYWRLLPEIMEDRPPRTRGPGYVPLPHHHADKISGLYTGVELQDWNHLQGFPRFSEALQGDLAQGGCNNYKGCPLTAVPGGSAFNFGKLEEGALAAITPAWMTTLLKVYKEMASVGGIVAWVLAGILIYQRVRQAKKGSGTTTTNVVVSSLPPATAPLPPPPPSFALVPAPPRRSATYHEGVELAPLLPHDGGLQAQQLVHLPNACSPQGGCKGEMGCKGVISQGQEMALRRYFRPDAALL